jgi:hypothetical protein
MQPTGASIAIPNKSALITSPTISSGNGAIAVARHAITFLSAQCSSEKCEWARTLQTWARERPRLRNHRRRQVQLVLLLRELRLRQLPQLPLHLRPAVRLRQ